MDAGLILNGQKRAGVVVLDVIVVVISTAISVESLGILPEIADPVVVVRHLGIVIDEEKVVAGVEAEIMIETQSVETKVVVAVVIVIVSDPKARAKIGIALQVQTVIVTVIVVVIVTVIVIVNRTVNVTVIVIARMALAQRMVPTLLALVLQVANPKGPRLMESPTENI